MLSTVTELLEMTQLIPQSSGERGGGVGADPEVFYPIFVLPIYAVKKSHACSQNQEKPAKRPRKGGSEMLSVRRYLLSKGGNKHMRTLNNTEWGGGGGRGKMQHFIDPSIRPQQVPGRNICFFLQTFCPWRKTLIY